VLAAFAGALARSLDSAELLRALEVAVSGLLHEAAHVPEIAEPTAQVESQLRELTRAWPDKEET